MSLIDLFSYSLPLIRSYQLCLCVLRYVSVTVVEEKDDCIILALSCSDGAIRLVTTLIRTINLTVAFALQKSSCLLFLQ